ncbi:hypothetical protein SDJN02_06874 [Cucurbita argyrosperma subsp. argyrosperma]|nr:hypothetical protein SDJN02_06874 [Cucurbita argyrosperma subsp. argyrosperma]
MEQQNRKTKFAMQCRNINAGKHRVLPKRKPNKERKSHKESKKDGKLPGMKTKLSKRMKLRSFPMASKLLLLRIPLATKESNRSNSKKRESTRDVYAL